ncbi:MAG: type II secretion system protein M [Acidobacteria bacterium]|nr:type II secretion system protein M [Acidobacteriota bacterium]
MKLALGKLRVPKFKKWARFSPRERALLLVAAGVGTVTVLLVFIVFPFVDSQKRMAEELELKKETLRRYKEIVAEKELYVRRLESANKLLRERSTRLLAGDNPSLASTDLQRLLNDLVARNTIELQRMDPPRVKVLNETYQQISIQFQTQCMPQQFVPFLHALITHEKLLTVDDVNISSLKIGQNVTKIRPLITISGYLYAPTKKEEAPRRAEVRLEHWKAGRMEDGGDQVSILPAFRPSSLPRMFQ